MALSGRNRDIFTPGVLDARHVLERIPWPRHGSTAASARTARAEIAAARYDIALIASEEPEAYDLARGIPERSGFTTGWAKPLKSLWVHGKLTQRLRRSAALRSDDRHEVDIAFSLGRRLHGDTAPTRDPQRLRPLLLAEPASPTGRREAPIVVQLGTKWSTIGVETAAAKALVAALVARGARLVASSGEATAALAMSGGAPVTLCPDVSVWKKAISDARLVVTPDTGAAHLAGMLGIPVVDVFADANATAHIARWHPWAAPYVALVAADLNGGRGQARIEQAVDAL